VVADHVNEAATGKDAGPGSAVASATWLTANADPIDTVRVFETPEGVDLNLRLAGPVPRAAALAIDILIRYALYVVLLPLVALAGVGIGLMLIGLFLIEWFYPVFFELRGGATPGKKVMGLVVVHHDGTPVGPSASMIRNLLRVVDFLPVLYATGMASMLIDKDFRRLGDLAAGTLVVYAERPRGERAIPVRPPLPPSRTLSIETQQAILDFAERSPRLSVARRAELAELAPSADGARGQLALDNLLGIANWIARGR
jgi:uncharacterized RDD family membrane protein YckC